MIMFGFTSCNNTEHNTLTDQEKAEGWQLLFDGETLNGWRDYNGIALTGPWEVVDGTIQANGHGSDANGYIVTDKIYENFEITWTGRYQKEEIAGYYTMFWNVHNLQFLILPARNIS